MLRLCGPEPEVALATDSGSLDESALEESASSFDGQQPKPKPQEELSITLIPKAPRRQRDLTVQEGTLLKGLKKKRWVVSCMVTPPEMTGPDGAISYLARYVAGVAISDARLVSDSDGIVTISYKDYRDTDTKSRKMLELRGAEFTLRFVLHILPRSMARVRHSGLFQASKRKERLATCRELLAMMDNLLR